MNQEITTMKDTAPPSQVSETAEFIGMIERAARDPAVDVAKLKGLMELRADIEAMRAKREFSSAMTLAQTAMRPIAADAANKQTNSKYASHAALMKAIQPLYIAHGFSLSFDTGEAPAENTVRVLCYVEHVGGGSRTYHIDMPADGKGAKGGDVMTRTHAAGSAVTYGMRYLLKMIFNIAVGGDDDGNAAANTEKFLTNDQVASLTKLIKDTGGSIEKFCKFAKVEALENIYSSRYEAAVQAVKNAALERKKNAKKESVVDPEKESDGWPGPISKDQAETIRTLIVATKSDTKKFCQFMGVKAISEIEGKDYDRAIEALNKKKGRSK